MPLPADDDKHRLYPIPSAFQLNGQQAAPTSIGETHQQQHSLRDHYQRRSEDEFGGITRRNLDGHAAGEDGGMFSQVENITPFARDLRMNRGRRYSTSPVRTNTYSSVPVQIERDTVAPSPTFGVRAFDATLVNPNPPLHLGPTSEGQYQRCPRDCLPADPQGSFARGHSTRMELLLRGRVQSYFATSYGSIGNVARRPAQQPRPRQANHQRSGFGFNGEAGISAYNRGTPTTNVVESPSRFAASLLPSPPDNRSGKSVVAPSELTMNDDRHPTPGIATHNAHTVSCDGNGNGMGSALGSSRAPTELLQSPENRFGRLQIFQALEAICEDKYPTTPRSSRFASLRSASDVDVGVFDQRADRVKVRNYWNQPINLL